MSTFTLPLPAALEQRHWGTPLWMDPAVRELKKGNSKSSDVYSLALVAHTLLCGDRQPAEGGADMSRLPEGLASSGLAGMLQECLKVGGGRASAQELAEVLLVAEGWLAEAKGRVTVREVAKARAVEVGHKGKGGCCEG